MSPFRRKLTLFWADHPIVYFMVMLGIGAAAGSVLAIVFISGGAPATLHLTPDLAPLQPLLDAVGPVPFLFLLCMGAFGGMALVMGLVLRFVVTANTRKIRSGYFG